MMHKNLITDSFSLWRKNWIPIFEFQGEWYGVSCKLTSIAASPVQFYFVEDDPNIAYYTLTLYMQYMARLVTQGDLTWEDSFWSDGDPKTLNRVYSQLKAGPKFPYNTND